ncbi:dTMP kinase [Phytohabitans suffuscus]|uniref:Thymidylate kinase n=1 Tax=Phytohabitans suffuscus TaxID=624315 RepID=A0A6F8YDR1_9ACTN|nr:hypothetical protein [Phytohabitans suffuscus]BCB84274.1 hypothetical protein Psuf_015870 [Phytohabitans suffuscus]
MTGVLVALEGPKLVGKTTLVDRLREYAPSQDWVFTKEPTAAFDLANEELAEGLTLAVKIADDRAHHISTEIGPALSEGRVVITDRFVLSSFVFHCGDGVEASAIKALNRDFPPPDIVVILMCSPNSLRQRREARGISTRLSTKMTAEQELVTYLEYADLCRPASNEVLIGYNERMGDCDALAKRIIFEIEQQRTANV